MNKDGFLRFLQQLLTMVDEESDTSVMCARVALESVNALARESGKSDGVTLRMMDCAIGVFPRLVHYRKDFAGVPGDYSGNAAKRRHLAMMIMPGC